MPTTLADARLDEIVAGTDLLVARLRSEGSRLGYFAVLHRDASLRVRQAIAAGRFEDGRRLERLHVLFARRYLDAMECREAGRPAPRAWQFVFDTARLRGPTILQHLLIGVHAHVNLDLGAAAARVAPGPELPRLRRDFETLTQVFEEMVTEVQRRLARVSPWLGLLDRTGVRAEGRVCSFSMREARDVAWCAAERLARLHGAQFERELERHDRAVAGLGSYIRSPGRPTEAALALVRLREAADVARVMDALAA